MGCLISSRSRYVVRPQKLDAIEAPNDAAFQDRKRATTDSCFLLFHSTYLIAVGALIVYCTIFGNISRILYGHDNCGNICGVYNLVKEKQRTADCKGVDLRNRNYYLVFEPDEKHQLALNVTYTGQRSLDYSVPQVLWMSAENMCVNSCSMFPYYRSVLNRCYVERTKNAAEYFYGKTGLKDFLNEVSEDLELCCAEILYLSLLSFVFSFLLTILLRYLVGVLVWIVLIGVGLACLMSTIYLWVLWQNSKSPQDEMESRDLMPDVAITKSGNLLSLSIIATVVTVFVVVMTVALRKRIGLVIQLFKEAGKAVAAMPLLLFQPLLTFLCIVALIASWLYMLLWIESSGHERMVKRNYYVYEKDVVMHLARWLNVLAGLWMLQFIIGCQHMTIAGAISAWYFTRDKRRVSAPIFYSLYNLTRFHLGTVSLGSFVIAFVQLIRIIVALFHNILKNRNASCINCCVNCCRCCLGCLENALKYLTRNAYIETAIYGYSFCRSGKQAFKVVATNAIEVAAIGSVGDFVLLLGKIFVIMATEMIGIGMLQKKEGLLHMWVPLLLIGIVAFVIAHCFLTVYEVRIGEIMLFFQFEMTHNTLDTTVNDPIKMEDSDPSFSRHKAMAIDTIFICFCEDYNSNDGLSRPYFMSKDLMEFVRNSKKTVTVLVGESQQNQTPITTVSEQVDR